MADVLVEFTIAGGWGALSQAGAPRGEGSILERLDSTGGAVTAASAPSGQSGAPVAIITAVDGDIIAKVGPSPAATVPGAGSSVDESFVVLNGQTAWRTLNSGDKVAVADYT